MQLQATSFTQVLCKIQTLWSKEGIIASKIIKIWQYQNACSSNLSSFKCNSYTMAYSFWLIIVYNDFSCLVLSKSGVPSS